MISCATNETNDCAINEKQPKKQKPKANVEEELSLSENDDLTDKQRLFCIYYTKYFNATKAYQKVYESAYTTARTNGSRMLTNANIFYIIDPCKP